MEQSEQTRRWETAQEHYKAAELLLNQGLHKPCASRCYYACFQAMWVAVGDPPLGHWKHAGLMQTFSLGKWITMPVLPTSFALIYKKLLAVYDLRLDADYRALSVTQAKAQEALQTTKQVLDLIAQHKNL
jgi:uncharacterized protein (UPF0332 family)